MAYQGLKLKGKFIHLTSITTQMDRGFYSGEGSYTSLNLQENCKGKKEENFNGKVAYLLRVSFHIEGDWRPFEDGILWENEGTTSPVENYRIKQIIKTFLNGKSSFQLQLRN